MRFALLLGALLVFLSAGATTRAGAVAETTTTDISQSQLDQCIGTAPVGVNPTPARLGRLSCRSRRGVGRYR